MTTIQRFDPFRELRRVNRLMPAAFPTPFLPAAAAAGGIPMDVRRSEGQLTVAAALPGFTPDEVDVCISPDRVLTVKATRQAEAEQPGGRVPAAGAALRQRPARPAAARRPGFGRRRRVSGTRHPHRNRAGSRGGADAPAAYRRAGGGWGGRRRHGGQRRRNCRGSGRVSRAGVTHKRGTERPVPLQHKPEVEEMVTARNETTILRQTVSVFRNRHGSHLG